MHEGVEAVQRVGEVMTIEEAKEQLREIKQIIDTEERVEAIEELLLAFSAHIDGEGPRADFLEALGQLYLFEKTLHEKGL